MAKNNNRNRNGLPRVTDQEIANMANLGVSAQETVDEAVAERAGSDDKVGAVMAENAPPRVKTFTPEGRAWMERDPFGLQIEGIYGKKGQTALQPEDLQRHAQFQGNPLGVAELEAIHGKDQTAPVDGVACPICTKLVTSFVRTALIDRTTGDLVRDRGTGEVIYRGQFVAVGPDALDLKVHGAHPGECLFKLRVRRDRDGNAMSEQYADGRGIQRQRWIMLDAQSFDQANARVTAVREGILAKRNQRTAENTRVKQALGFTVGDGVRHPADDGIDRGSFAPKTPRGQSRKQRRWVENEDAAE